MTAARVAVVALVLVATAGCVGAGTDAQADVLEAEPVTDVPDRVAVVDHGNETIADVGPIQTVLADAAESDGRSRVELSRHEAEEVEDALSDLPHHDGTYARSGYYIRMDGRTYRVVVLVEQGE